MSNEMKQPDSYARAINAHEKMTCLMPGCAFCTNFIKDEIDAAVGVEREACAQMVDLRATIFGGEPTTPNERMIVEHIAAAIRARSELTAND